VVPAFITAAVEILGAGTWTVGQIQESGALYEGTGEAPTTGAIAYCLDHHKADESWFATFDANGRKAVQYGGEASREGGGPR
jgi:hypothetical protein